MTRPTSFTDCNNASIQDAAEFYASKGLQCVKVEPRLPPSEAIPNGEGKAPCENEWPTRDYGTIEKVKPAFINHQGNIGLRGNQADGFMMLDFDDVDFANAMLNALPMLGETLQSEGQKTGVMGHYSIRLTEPLPTKSIVKNKKTLTDMRGFKGMCVVAPSIHPNGNKYQWRNNNPIQTLETESFLTALDAVCLELDLTNPYREEPKPIPPESTGLFKVIKDAISIQQYLTTSKTRVFCPLRKQTSTAPAFRIFSHTKSFHCFSCHVAGDVIVLHAKLKGFEGVGAMTESALDLAKQFGVDVSEFVKEEEKELQVRWAKEILESTPEATEWVVNQLVPKGSLTILAAKRATYKTSIALSLALKVARGEDVFNFFPSKKTNTMLIDGESGPWLLPQYLKRFGGVVTDEFCAVELAAFDLLRQKDAEKLKQLIEKHEIGLIIIDSLRRALKGDENDSSNLSKFLTAIKQIGNETGCAFILIHHERKSQGFQQASETDYFDILDSLRGSGDISAAADLVIQLKRQGHQDLIELYITKSRYGPEGEPYTLTKTIRTLDGYELNDFSAQEGTLDNSDAMKTTVLMWIWDLGVERVITNEIQEKWKSMFSERNVARLISRLKDELFFLPGGKKGTHELDLTEIKAYLLAAGEIEENEGQQKIGD